MRLGIDVSRYKHGQATGVELYSKELVDAMLPLLKKHEAVEEVVFYSPNEFDLPVDSAKFTKRIIPFPRFWTMTRLSYEILTKTPDCLFVPSHTIPLIYPRRSVVTIHDIAFKRFKYAYSFFHYLHLVQSTKFAVKNAHKIIVPSEATKHDLMSFFNCPEDKIAVIPHGQPHFIKPQNLSSTSLQKFGIDESTPFMLFVGRIELKKNLVFLVEAFNDFLKEFPEWKLVISGKDGIGAKEIRDKIAELGIENSVILTGYVDDEEKSLLYEKSQFVVFPSLYEGFGFPILEAFQHEKPLLTAKGSACQEVAGEAAVIVESHDKQEMRDAMSKLALNEKLRKELVKAGKERLKEYSWQKAAEQTLDVLLS